MVDPEVGDEVESEHLGEAAGVRPPGECTQPDEDAHVGNDDLAEFMRLEERRTRDEVCRIARQINYCPGCGLANVKRLTVGEFRIPLLSGCVEDDVHGPTEELRDMENVRSCRKSFIGVWSPPIVLLHSRRRR